MEPTLELIDALFRDKVRQARATPRELKLFSGIELFEFGCEIMTAGIRHQFPGIDEKGVQDKIHQRMAWSRRLEESD